jgi:hypothetical protein
VVPIAISALVVALVACGALGLYAFRKHNESTMQIASESPTPLGGPARSTPSPSPEMSESAAETPTAPKKTEKTARNEEPKKAPSPQKQDTPRAEADVRGHEEETQPPDVPVPPEFQRQNRPRKPMVRVMPGGVVIRTLPDGSQIITTPDGGRFMISKDGTRTVLSPARPNRRRATPAPTPPPQ